MGTHLKWRIRLPDTTRAVIVNEISKLAVCWEGWEVAAVAVWSITQPLVFLLKALQKPLGAREEWSEVENPSTLYSASLFLSVSPPPPHPHILYKFVSTPLGTAGWESIALRGQHAWKRLLCKRIDADVFLLTLGLKLDLCLAWFFSQTHKRIFFSVRREGGGKKKVEKIDFCVISAAALLLGAEVHLRREISEPSLQLNSPELSARLPPGNPPNGSITRNSHALNLLDCTCWHTLRAVLCCRETLCTVFVKLLKHLSRKHILWKLTQHLLF